MIFPSWKQLFIKENENLSKEEQYAIIDHIQSTKTTADMWERSESEMYTFFLVKLENKDDPVLIYSLTTIKGNRKELTGKTVFAALTGLRNETSTLVFEPTKLFKKVAYKAFPEDKVVAAKTAKDLGSVKPPAANSPEAKAATPIDTRMCIPVPQAEVILQSPATTAIDLAMLAREEIFATIEDSKEEEGHAVQPNLSPTDEEEKSEEETENEEKQKDETVEASYQEFYLNGGAVLQWLLEAHAKLIQGTSFDLPLTGTLIQDTMADVKLCRLGAAPSPQASAPTGEEAANFTEGVERLEQLVEKQTNAIVSKVDEKKNKKQDSLYRKFLELASSVDGEEKGKLTPTMEEILQTSSKTDKLIVLKMALQGRGFDDPELCKAQADAFITGGLDYSPLQPAGASIFLLNVPGSDLTDIKENNFVVLQKRNVGMEHTISEAEFKKYVDKSAKVPSTLDEALDVMYLHCAIFEVLFGLESKIVECYVEFIQELRTQNVKTLTKMKISLNPEYLIDILYALDQTFNMFFKQCGAMHASCELINYEILHLDQLISKIMHGQLVVDVKPTFLKKIGVWQGK